MVQEAGGLFLLRKRVPHQLPFCFSSNFMLRLPILSSPAFNEVRVTPSASDALCRPTFSTGSVSRSHLYAKYLEVSEALSVAEANNKEMSETLKGLLSEIDAKIPRIIEQRHELQSLSQVPLLMAT